MAMYLGDKPVKVAYDLPYKHTSVEEAFTSRQTANGLTLVEPSPAVVEMIKGKTVKSENLIPFPYRIKTSTSNGIDITVNDDGTIVFNGTAEKQFYPTLALFYPETLPKGTYYLSGNPSDAYISIGADAKTKNGGWVKTLKINNGTVTVDWEGYERIDIYYVIQSGAVLDNLIVYPMFNEGSTKKPYTPYFSGLKHANFKAIKSTGKNLLRTPYSFPSSLNGVIATTNYDGSIKIVGTATARTVLTLGNYTQDMLSAGTYYISGKSEVSGVNINIECYKDNTYIKNFGVANRKFTIDWNGYNKVRFYYNIPSGTTVDNTLYPMLNFGDTAQPYEPYKVEEYKYAKFKNTNNLAKNEYSDNKETVEAVTFTRTNGASYFEVHRNGEQTKAAGRQVFKTTIQKAGTYTISVSDIPFNRVEISRGTTYMISLNKGGAMRHTFTLTSDNTEIYIVAVVSSADTIGTETAPTRINVMLNEGNTALPYEVDNVELPEYDYINPQTGEYAKGTRTIVCNGTENWQATGGNYNTYKLDIYPKVSSKSTVIHSSVPFGVRASGGNSTIGYSIIEIYDNTFTSVEEVKSYLASNPLTISYNLKTPTIETLTDYPKGYQAKNGGSETVEQGDTDNSQWGAVSTPTITYLEKLEGNYYLKVPIIKCYGKNLIPFPYDKNTYTSRGLTFTVNADGSVTVTGTATSTGGIDFILVKGERIPLVADSYTLSGSNGKVRILVEKNNNVWLNSYVSSPTHTGTFNIGDVIQNVRLYVWISTVGTEYNETVYPMLNFGETAQLYEPYKEPWYEY